MTGYGEAQAESGPLNVVVEVRAVNNRYLKINLRCPDAYHVLEAEVEKTVRQVVRRGTLQLQLSTRRAARSEDYRLNLTAVRSYLEQLRLLGEDLAIEGLSVASVLHLPGVIESAASSGGAPQEEWPVIEPVLIAALQRLQAMRREEGRAMAEELVKYLGEIRQALSRVGDRAPAVVANYQDRLREKITKLLAEESTHVDSAQLVREVALYAERTDIAEEITRLDCHLQQFSEMLNEQESPGRKLDFLIQEMVREVNTIGSKANDVEIARQVVEMKGTVEKMRELVQNVE